MECGRPDRQDRLLKVFGSLYMAVSSIWPRFVSNVSQSSYPTRYHLIGDTFNDLKPSNVLEEELQSSFFRPNKYLNKYLQANGISFQAIVQERDSLFD